MNISLVAEKLFSIGGLPVTNSLLIAWCAILFLCILSFFATRNLKQLPGRLQNICEAALEAILDLIQGVFGDMKQTRKFFSFIATLFLFVLIVNWVEILPGVGSIGIREAHEGNTVLIPLFRSTSADLNFTLALAILVVFTVQIVGIVSIGFWKYLSKFLNLSSPLNFFVGILELVSEVAKVISFSFRLFGNIFAGEVLLIVMYYLVPWVVPLPFLVMEIFVGLIQALVFSLLAIVFIKMATSEAH